MQCRNLIFVCIVAFLMIIEHLNLESHMVHLDSNYSTLILIVHIVVESHLMRVVCGLSPYHKSLYNPLCTLLVITCDNAISSEHLVGGYCSDRVFLPEKLRILSFLFEEFKNCNTQVSTEKYSSDH